MGCHRWLYGLKQAAFIRRRHNTPMFIHEIIGLGGFRIAGLQKRRQLCFFDHQEQCAQRLAAIDIDDHLSQCKHRRVRIGGQNIPLLHAEPMRVSIAPGLPHRIQHTACSNALLLFLPAGCIGRIDGSVFADEHSGIYLPEDRQVDGQAALHQVGKAKLLQRNRLNSGIRFVKTVNVGNHNICRSLRAAEDIIGTGEDQLRFIGYVACSPFNQGAAEQVAGQGAQNKQRNNQQRQKYRNDLAFEPEPAKPSPDKCCKFQACSPRPPMNIQHGITIARGLEASRGRPYLGVYSKNITT
ncbi:hypothetical protein D3C73_608030 [compost metagenome]